MNIVELLSLRGLDVTAKIKLVRHQDKRYDFRELVRKELFDLYQLEFSIYIIRVDVFDS